MGPVVDPVSSDETLPQRVSVVIVGGGIIGASTALFLAKRGVSVALCEKGQIAGEQSSRNWGWVRKMGRDPRELPLAGMTQPEDLARIVALLLELPNTASVAEIPINALLDDSY